MTGRRLAVRAGVLLGLLGAMFAPTFAWMVERWREPDSYYSHGFLVPAVTAFLLWRRRAELRAGPSEPAASRRAFACLAAGTALHVFGIWRGVFFFSGVSLIPVLAGATGILLGARAFRAGFWPWLFLYFMVPLPMVTVAGLSFWLKTAATRIAMLGVSQAGIPWVLRGSYVLMPHAKLLIGDVCSGLRSLISLLALGALFAYMVPISAARRLALLLAAAPIALGANALRIFLLCIVAELYGEKAATGWFHDLSGMLLFVAAFMGLELTARALESGRSRFSGGAA
jgi:exosortase